MSVAQCGFRSSGTRQCCPPCALESELNPRKNSPQTSTDTEFKVSHKSHVKDIQILLESRYKYQTKEKYQPAKKGMFDLRKLLFKFHSYLHTNPTGMEKHENYRNNSSDHNLQRVALFACYQHFPDNLKKTLTHYSSQSFLDDSVKTFVC